MDDQQRCPAAAVESPSARDAPAAGVDARMVVLVEGTSDQVALQALAARCGRDLAAEGVRVVPMGGARNIGRFLELFGPRGLDLSLVGLCDASEEVDFRRGLERAGLGSSLGRAEMVSLGFYVCVADLEDELIRCLGTAGSGAAARARGRARVVPRLPAPTCPPRKEPPGPAPALHGHPQRPQAPLRAVARRGAGPHERA